MADLRTIRRMQRLRDESQPLGDQLFGMMGGEQGRGERLNMNPLDANNPLSYLSAPNQIGGKVLPALLAEYLSYIQSTTPTGRVKDITETTVEPYTNILSGRGGLEDYTLAALGALPAAKYAKPFYKAARKGNFLKGEQGGADFEFLMRALRQRLDNPQEALKSVPVKHIPTPLKKKKKKKKDKGIKKDFPAT